MAEGLDKVSGGCDGGIGGGSSGHGNGGGEPGDGVGNAFGGRFNDPDAVAAIVESGWSEVPAVNGVGSPGAA